jgi:hypothetical protein
VIEEITKASLEMNSSPSRETTPDPAGPSATRDDGDTRYEEARPSKAGVGGGETMTVPKKIRL